MNRTDINLACPKSIPAYPRCKENSTQCNILIRYTKVVRFLKIALQFKKNKCSYTSPEPSINLQRY